ncbi:hypothetical protein pipiens_007667 [Culex pipiens pipiens]|uniref:Uncharacterized protein n=1 Tax=Culex pipiens pipiens TaxID=38569 RepID=A0ABD1DKA8_CULPP
MLLSGDAGQTMELMLDLVMDQDPVETGTKVEVLLLLGKKEPSRTGKPTRTGPLRCLIATGSFSVSLRLATRIFANTQMLLSGDAGQTMELMLDLVMDQDPVETGTKVEVLLLLGKKEPSRSFPDQVRLLESRPWTFLYRMLRWS